MKRCGHCGADFDDRVDFCFNDGTPLEKAVVTAVPGAPPKRSQSSRFSNALAGIDAPEAGSLQFDAPDSRQPVSPAASEARSGFVDNFSVETTEPVDVPELSEDDYPFFSEPEDESLEQAVNDVEDIDVDLDADTEEAFFDDEDEVSKSDELGDDFGFMQDTGELEADVDYLFTENTPNMHAQQSSKIPLIMGAAAILIAIGASFAMMSGSEEPEEEALFAEAELQDIVVEELEMAPIAGEIEIIDEEGEGSDEGQLSINDEELVEPEEDVQEAGTEAEEPLESDEEEDQGSVEPEREAEAPTMPIALNRPANRPEPEPEQTVWSGQSQAEQEQAAPVREPAAASPAPASPWGAVATGGQNTAASSRIRVQSTPSGARVLVDGASQGTTPADFTLPIGSHLISIEKDGYERYSQNLSVQHDSHMVRATLEAVANTNFDVVVSFYGASGWRVFEANVPLCTIPCSQQLSTGTHEFRVVNDSESWVVTRDIQGQYAGASVGVNLQRD